MHWKLLYTVLPVSRKWLQEIWKLSKMEKLTTLIQFRSRHAFTPRQNYGALMAKMCILNEDCQFRLAANNLLSVYEKKKIIIQWQQHWLINMVNIICGTATVKKCQFNGVHYFCHPYTLLPLSHWKFLLPDVSLIDSRSTCLSRKVKILCFWHCCLEVGCTALITESAVPNITIATVLYFPLSLMERLLPL